jgi:glycosyltransferase involved in cell wall biosynthesis
MVAVAPVTHPGGAETTLLRLLSGLRRHGWELTLTTPGLGPLRDQAVAEGLQWGRLPLGGLQRGTGRRALGSYPVAWRLGRASDVVYLNGGVPARVLPAVARARTHDRPKIVLHIHDMVDRVPSFWHQADVVLAASQAVADRLGGLDAQVVYVPVDPDPPVADPPWALDPAAPVIGFIGRIEPRKGPLDLVKAVPLIRAHIPEARFVVVGDEPFGLNQAYANEVIAAPEIEHYPWSDNAPGLMRHLDVLVLPSYEEPAGTVLAEAMAVGTPVVATRVDGLPEVVRDGVTGRLVAPGDPQQLADAVLDVLARRSEMGEAAREHATRFHADAYVRHVEPLIAP